MDPLKAYRPTVVDKMMYFFLDRTSACEVFENVSKSFPRQWLTPECADSTTCTLRKKCC